MASKEELAIEQLTAELAATKLELAAIKSELAATKAAWKKQYDDVNNVISKYFDEIDQEPMEAFMEVLKNEPN
jgi:hypothetical protein